MLTYINHPQNELSEGLPNATCESPFNPWLLPASVPNAWQKPDWNLTTRAARSRLPLLQGDPDQPAILAIVQFALKGVQS